MSSYHTGSVAPRRSLGMIAFFLVLAGCYDHRFTQAIMERNRRAREAEGAKIQAARASTPKGGMRRGRVRFYVAKAFTEQHREWRHAVASLVEAANGVIGPNFALQLELGAVSEWQPKCDPAHLDACVTELAKLEAGEDGDWIVGVLGATPSFTASFEHLGMAGLMSRHFVVRDVADLAERAAIDAGFASMTPARRDEIYKRRKTHKRLAIFLHEWGHTLGALHVQSVKSLLNPTYDDDMETFDEANQGLIDASLRDLFRYAGSHDELKAYLQSPAGGELPAEGRNELLARLPSAQPHAEAMAAGGGEVVPTTPEHPFLVRGSDDELLAGWAVADRDAYRKAAVLTASGDTSAALSVAKPLAERHPDTYAVQHLLCSLAMQHGQQDLAEQACPRAIKASAPSK